MSSVSWEDDPSPSGFPDSHLLLSSLSANTAQQESVLWVAAVVPDLESTLKSPSQNY